MLNEKLDKLPKLTLENMHKIDRGRASKQFAKAMDMVIANISDYPCRDGKPETRSVTIQVFITPELKMKKQAIELPHGVREIDVPEICGLLTRLKIKSAIPDAETSDVRMAVELRSGRIADARFNPDNNDAPEQLELFEEDDVTDPGH